MFLQVWLLGGIPSPLKNITVVSWDDDIPNTWNNNIHVPVTTNQLGWCILKTEAFGQQGQQGSPARMDLSALNVYVYDLYEGFAQPHHLRCRRILHILKECQTETLVLTET